MFLNAIFFNAISARYLCTLLIITASCFCLFTVAQAQDKPVTLEMLEVTVSKLDQLYPTKTIQTAPAADAALEAVELNQTQLQAWYLRTRRACYDHFFVNNCLDVTKLSRRKYSVILQRISVEAKTYKRQERIEQLDAELKLKNEQKQLDGQKKQ